MIIPFSAFWAVVLLGVFVDLEMEREEDEDRTVGGVRVPMLLLLFREDELLWDVDMDTARGGGGGAGAG